MKDQRQKRMLPCCMTFLLLALITSTCLAGGVQISYPDGSPAATAAVKVLADNRYQFEFTTDNSGYFRFPTNDFSTATISVKAPTGQEFIPVTLPSAIIASGDTALVLQPLH